MKKFFEFLDFLWDNEILSAIAYLITLGWFAYALGIISSHGSALGRIFFFVWAMVLVFIWMIHKSNKNE
ncbi:MAG: hypothetical protein E7629_03705 [Ruminococcaceae bacterium]|nr:hypothetical protein [Oscillospiraceae bacterium]